MTVEIDLPVLDVVDIVPESLEELIVGSSDRSKELTLLRTFSENEDWMNVDGDMCVEV